MHRAIYHAFKICLLCSPTKGWLTIGLERHSSLRGITLRSRRLNGSALSLLAFSHCVDGLMMIVALFVLAIDRIVMGVPVMTFGSALPTIVSTLSAITGSALMSRLRSCGPRSTRSDVLKIA